MENNKSRNLNTDPWVFVYGNVTPADDLEGSEEPIIELTECDMYLTASDTDSDRNTDTSDGISIISESEIPLEDNFITYNDCENIEDIHYDQIFESQIDCINPVCTESVIKLNAYPDFQEHWIDYLHIFIGIMLSFVIIHCVLSYRKMIESVLDPQDEYIKYSVYGKRLTDEIVDYTLSCASYEKHVTVKETNDIKWCVYNSFSSTYLKDEGKESTTSRNDNVVEGDNVFVKPPKMDRDKPKKFKSKKDPTKVSGEWYYNNHKYRAKLRKHDRDRAQWYFKRVNARQELRRKARKAR